ncbi:MAG TPA: S8 family serine peptidase, partial [Candidatus Dojkabacteria bacterium]|nr:S8 family serine peptidase [Candidatus Dojkabacteria bacterium]
MKNIISNSLQKVLLIIFVLAINLTNLFAQANPKLQAIVMFEKNIITLPHGNTEADVNELKIKSFEVKNIFSKYNARFIRKAFPLFSPNDTLVIASTGEQVKLADLSNIYLFDFSDTNSVSEFINDIKGLTEVIYAEPNYHDFRTQGFPNDPHYENGDLWGLNNYGQNGGTTDADIDAPEAWQITQGSETVKVGIIDTGVEITHDDLNGKSAGDLPESYYSYGHGTHVAGIVGAKNNGGEVKGVSPNTSIVSRKVFSGVDYYGRALWAGDNNAYSKIMAAINEGCSILNHSYGGPNYSTTLRIAFANITKFNRSSTVSMGNSNSSSLSYPAAFGQGIIAVGSTDNFDLRSQDNTPGYEWGSNFGNHIDVTAPGGKYAFINDKNILSTWPGNSYLKISGTSMASPVVSGIASLLKAYNSNLFNDDIEQIIRISAEDKGDPGWDQYYGTGRVNAYNALRLLQAPYQLSQLSVSSG